MKMPMIKSVMTPFPYWVAVKSRLSEADRIMRERSVQHLPVKDEGLLVGVLTRSHMDHYLLHSSHDSFDDLSVEEVCIREVYVVDLDEPLDNVLYHMANHHIGSALVTRQGRLAGLFTHSDACRCFAGFLRDKYRPPTGDDAA